ncbi:LAFA_0E13256g1_1 [Lachancea sp. 'fantastica']|nr:LAFA_0E13256g1_1 [Lachancea sp. 'fantastica']
MLFDTDYLIPGTPEIPVSVKSRLAGVLKTFHLSTRKARHTSELTAPKPHIYLESSGITVSAKQSQTFLDVVQDYLPQENEDTRNYPTASEKRDNHTFLNVHKGDIVHLIAIAPNNLVQVRLVNGMGQGLVPTRCLALNRNLTPSMSPELDSTPEAFQSPTRRVAKSAAAASLFSSSPASFSPTHQQPDIRSCEVEAIDLWDNRIWYKIRCVMKTGHHRVLSRFYQDFYSLQLLIKNQLVGEHGEIIQGLFPLLPSPCRSITPCQIKSRIAEFNSYLGNILGSSAIPEDVKIDVIQNLWLSPKPGDVVITPRGSTFKVSPSISGSESWEAVSDKSQSSINDFAKHLDPAIGIKSRAVSFSARRSTYESSTIQRQTQSAPATPALSKFQFEAPGQEVKDIKVKFVYDEECYVAKCAASELQSYQQLDRLCHAKLTGCLPDATFPLEISLINVNNKPVVLTEKSFRPSIAEFHSGKLASHNMTCSNLKKLVLHVTPLK